MKKHDIQFTTGLVMACVGISLLDSDGIVSIIALAASIAGVAICCFSKKMDVPPTKATRPNSHNPKKDLSDYTTGR